MGARSLAITTRRGYGGTDFTHTVSACIHTQAAASTIKPSDATSTANLQSKQRVN